MRSGIEASQSATATGGLVQTDGSRAGASQRDTALPAYRRAEAGAGGDRARHGRGASHVPAAARRRGQRQDASGGGGGDHRDRKWLPGSGVGPDGNSGGAALLVFQETVPQAGLRDDSSDGVGVSA